VVLCLDEQNRAWFQIFQENSAFDFRLHNVVIHLVTQVLMGPEHVSLQARVHEDFNL
jgi:hypothetical protein